MENRVAVLKTLLYSDIFDYPLTKKEIWQYLISTKKVDINDIELELKKNENIDLKNNMYFLKGKKNLVNLRNKRTKISLLKLEKAKKIIRKLSLIPTIRFIGISGNLAVKNADKEDDIDLFIVAQKNTIWITRFAVALILKLLGAYRRREDKIVKDKICANMFLDENNLSFSKDRRDLFTAHELMQLVPMLDREGTYKKLLFINKWIVKFLPNFYRETLNIGTNVAKEDKVFEKLLAVVNHIVKFPQILYMKGYITNEEISDRILAFHPQSHKKFVLKQYEKRTQKYNL